MRRHAQNASDQAQCKAPKQYGNQGCAPGPAEEKMNLDFMLVVQGKGQQGEKNAARRDQRSSQARYFIHLLP